MACLRCGWNAQGFTIIACRCIMVSPSRAQQNCPSAQACPNAGLDPS